MDKSKDKLVEKQILAEQYERECWKTAFLTPENREEYHKAHNKVLELQREIAALDGSEYCIPFVFPYFWDTGAPLPYLLQNDNKTFLAYYLKGDVKDWDGKTVKVVSPKETQDMIAVVEFRAWYAALGVPNDEGLSGHPLWGKGLDYYTPLIVKNSHRIKNICNMFPPKWAEKLVHYIFPFHDSTFECVAENYTVEVVNDTMYNVVAQLCKKLFL